MNHGEHPHPVSREQSLELIVVELARVRDGNHLDIRTRPAGDELPRDDVGVMLHSRYQDLISRPEILAAPA